MSWSGPQDAQGRPGAPVPPPQAAPPQQAWGAPGQQAWGAHGQQAQWQQPAPWGGPAFQAPPPPKRPALLPAALPVGERAYAEALVPLERRAGRWGLAWAIALGFFLGGQVVGAALMLPALLGAIVALPLSAMQDPQAVTDAVFEAIGTPFGMLGVNIGWAAMIPGAIVAAAAFGRGAAGYVSSVAGTWRWGAVGRSALVVVPIFAVYIGLTLALDGSVEWRWDPNWGLVAVVLLTTPLQATGEEFAFRGFLTQMLGGWVRQRWVPLAIVGSLGLMVLGFLGLQGGANASMLVAVLVATAAAGIGPWVAAGRPLATAVWIGISTGLLFGSLHGHDAFSATLQLSLVGFACSMLTHRTGGLEAASVLHTANNVFIMVPLALTGQSAFSAQPVAGEDWLSLGIAAAALGLAYLAVHLTMPRAQRRTVGAPGAELLVPQQRLAPPVAVPTS